MRPSCGLQVASSFCTDPIRPRHTSIAPSSISATAAVGSIVLKQPVKLSFPNGLQTRYQISLPAMRFGERFFTYRSASEVRFFFATTKTCQKHNPRTF